MFTVYEDNSIYATRGDVVFFNVDAKTDSGEKYKFQAGDVLRVKIYGKKDAESVVMQKDFVVDCETEEVCILLTEEDTKIGEVISKPRDYWYEVELNPLTNPQTIIGYSEDGPAVFRLFPEGDDIPPVAFPAPEDVAVVDSELDLTSPRPIQNQAVAREVLLIHGSIGDLVECTGKLNAELAVERARIDNLAKLQNGSTTGDAELTDVRVGADGIIHANAGSAVRKQIGEIHDKVDQNGGVYALPLEFTANNTYYMSQPFPIPKDGMSLRVTEAMKTTINGVASSIFARVYLGRMENGAFVEDSDLIAEYAFDGYSNRTYFVPHIGGVYAKIHVVMLGNNESRLTAANIASYAYITDYVKVYTGSPKRSGGLLGAVVSTLAKDTDEGYKPDWGFRALIYKYQAMTSPLPLKYVRRVSCPADVWLGAKIYKFDPLTRKTAWVKTLHYCENHPCFGTECVIDFEEYGDNFFALLTFGRVPQYSAYNSTGYNGSTTGTSGVTCIGMDLTELVDSIQVEWLPGAVRSDAWGGSPIVQRNIELLKMNKHKAVPGKYVNNNTSDYNYILGKDDFAGVFYGGSYPGGMFFYNVSPATYYAALLNPNSNAYGDVDFKESGFLYGIMCSGFAVLTHGHPIPRSTFDLRYNPDVEGFDLKPMNLMADLHKLKPYDIITQGAGQTGHSVLLTGIENVGDICTALRVMEAATPATRENVFFLHNGVPYYKNESEAWYQDAYDFMAVSDPAYDEMLHDKANWIAPYTSPQPVMCNRGYGAVYLEGKTKVVLSVSTSVKNITIKKDGVTIGTYAVSGLNPVVKNGYNTVDITDKVSAGTIRVYNDANEGHEEFHVINVDAYSVSTQLDNEYLTVTVSHPDKVKYIEVNYHCAEGQYKGQTAPMFFRARFSGNSMKVPNRFVTDIGTFAMTSHADYRDYVNVIFKTDYDTNTFGIDAEGDKYV